MFNQSVNILAVLLSSIISYGASFVWFIFLFPKQYQEDLGKTAAELAKGPSLPVASFFQIVGNIVMAYVLALLIAKVGLRSVQQTTFLAIIVWGGFVAAVLGPMYAFQAFSLRFFIITSGSILLTFVITGLILGLWK